MRPYRNKCELPIFRVMLAQACCEPHRRESRFPPIGRREDRRPKASRSASESELRSRSRARSLSIDPARIAVLRPTERSLHFDLLRFRTEHPPEQQSPTADRHQQHPSGRQPIIIFIIYSSSITSSWRLKATKRKMRTSIITPMVYDYQPIEGSSTFLHSEHNNVR